MSVVVFVFVVAVAVSVAVAVAVAVVGVEFNLRPLNTTSLLMKKASRSQRLYLFIFTFSDRSESNLTAARRQAISDRASKRSSYACLRQRPSAPATETSVSS